MAYSSTTLPIESGGIYPMYNHATGEAGIFSKPNECERFLKDIGKRLPDVADVLAWCLMSNHFHMPVKVTGSANGFSKAPGESLNAYAKWYNTRNGRMGSVCVRPFKRKKALGDRHIRWPLWYIHRNPMHPRVTTHWEEYPWSSYRYFLNPENAPAFVNTRFLTGHFGNLELLIGFHQQKSSEFLEGDLV